jgi:hypothetical protein
MKISVNDEVLFTLTETQKQVIQNDVHGDIFDEDMKRRLQWVLTHKYEQCYKRLKDEWEPKLRSRINAQPTDPDLFAQLIFSQPDYRDRKRKDDEAKAAELAREELAKSENKEE